MMTFIDDQSMNRLYEKFILEYYRKEFPEIETNSSQVKWQLDDDYDELLPIMQTDVMLTKGSKIIIIDAKYYKNMAQSHFNTNKNHSQNLYQMFTYAKNKEAELKDKNYEVSGYSSME